MTLIQDGVSIRRIDTNKTSYHSNIQTDQSSLMIPNPVMSYSVNYQ